MSKPQQKFLKTLKGQPLASSQNTSNTVFSKAGSSRTSPRSTPKKTHAHSSDKKPVPSPAAEEGNIPEDEPIRNKIINNTSVKVPLTQSRLKRTPVLSQTRKADKSSKEKTPDTPSTTLEKPSPQPVSVVPQVACGNSCIFPVMDHRKSIDLNSAAMQVLKSSVLLENKSCENINVAIRIRPFTQQEVTAKQTREAWAKSPGGKLIDKKKAIVYALEQKWIDKVFWYDNTNQEVFTTVAQPLIISAMEGYNVSVFCYGQTGSGKTYTMYGDIATNPGVAVISIETIFAYIAATPHKEFVVRASYLEIYNERINDLLNITNSNLKLYEDAKKGTIVKGLTEKGCATYHDMVELLSVGERNKHFGNTAFNEKSSRAHVILRVYLESKNSTKYEGSAQNTKVLYSTVNLIDLAGSESAEAHRNAKVGPAKYEMLNINRSLLTLTAVISKLSEKSNQWIPYRDSKLTKYLENALQGNAKISIICNISPGEFSYEQSQTTLSFATMAKKIKQTVQRNETTEDDKKMLITQLEAEIKTLKERIFMLESSKTTLIKDPMPEDETTKMKEKLAKLLSKIASSSSLCESKDAPSKEAKKLPETFPIRVSQIIESLKQQNIIEEMKRNSIIQVFAGSVEKSSEEVTPFELCGDIKEEIKSLEKGRMQHTDEEYEIHNNNNYRRDLEKIEEVNSAKHGSENIESPIKELENNVFLLEDARPQMEGPDLVGEESMIRLPEYLDSKLSVIETNKDPENLELKTVLQEAEEALVEETVTDLQKQLMESDLEKQRLKMENKELTLAVNEMTNLLEAALGELKEYREKYGEIYGK